jgi:hypothetical protein
MAAIPGRTCEPLGVYHASTPEHNSDLSRDRVAFAIGAISRDFVLSVGAA